MAFTVMQGSERGSLRLNGELDVAEADEFIGRATSDLSPDADLVLELEGLTFIDSSGVRALVTVAGRLHGDHRLVLRDPTPAVRRVLDLVGITEAAATIVIDPSNADRP